MATYEEILMTYWPGNGWVLDGGDFATLQWFGPSAQPTLEQVQARNADTDLVLQRMAIEQSRNTEIMSRGGFDGLLRALKIVANGLDQLNTALRSNTTVFTAGARPTITNLGALRQVITDIETQYPYPAAPSVTPPTSPPP